MTEQYFKFPKPKQSEMPHVVQHINIGYIRVSSTDNRQELGLEVQKEAMKSEDLKYLFIEKASGRKDDRPEFNKAIEIARKWDSRDDVTFVVYKLDRLARKTSTLLKTIDDLREHGVKFKSIKENIDTNTAAGIFFYQMLAIFSEFEVNSLRQRTKDGLAEAKRQGKVLGRPKLKPRKRKKIIELYNSPDLRVSDVAKRAKVSISTVYRVIHDEGINLRKVE